MLNKPQLGAAILALSSCCPAGGLTPLTSQEIYRANIKEAQCLNVIMEVEPDILRPLDPCFNDEFACLREQIHAWSLVCTVEDEEKFY
jgi:hypothetical protein